MLGCVFPVSAGTLRTIGATLLTTYTGELVLLGSVLRVVLLHVLSVCYLLACVCVWGGGVGHIKQKV